MEVNNDRLLGQLEARISDLITDVRELRSDVAELKTDFIRRRSFNSILISIASLVAAAFTSYVTRII